MMDVLSAPQPPAPPPFIGLRNSSSGVSGGSTLSGDDRTSSSVSTTMLAEETSMFSLSQPHLEHQSKERSQEQRHYSYISTNTKNINMETMTNTTTPTTTNGTINTLYKLKMKIGSKLYGRDMEEELLRQTFSRMIRDQIPELLLLSGGGKTSLANSFRQTICNGKQGYYVTGKFENIQQTNTTAQIDQRPYEVFVSCLNDYIDQLLDINDENRIEEIRKVIKNTINNDYKMISDMVPTIKSIFENTTSTTNTPTASSTANGADPNLSTTSNSADKNGLIMSSTYGIVAQTKFRSLYAKLIQALTIQAGPLILLLDDIHYADTASCEMVKTLMNVNGKIKLFMIGAHSCNHNEFAAANTSTDNITGSMSNNSSHHRYELLSKMNSGMNLNGGTSHNSALVGDGGGRESSTSMASMQMKPFVATMIELIRERDHLQHRLRNPFANPKVLRIRSVELHNLTKKAVCDMLSDLLGKTENNIEELGDIIIEQTSGNVHHIIQLLHLLFDPQFLTKNIEDKWTWDKNQIINKLHPNTIKEMIQSMIMTLPRLTQETLKIASCMGDEIDDSALGIVLQVASVSQYLDVAAAEGLLVFYSYSGGYKFANSWIRKTVYDMIPIHEREEFHLKIGRKLWKYAIHSTTLIQRNIFIIVTLLNIGMKHIKEDKERYRVAELNVLAARKAAEVSAYPNASQFCRKAILLLSNRKWIDYYDLTLSLFSLAAEVEVMNGNYERVVLYIEEIMKKGQSLEDKLRAYAALITSMIQQNNLQEAYAVGIDVLRQLGENFPKSPSRFYITKKMTRVGMLLRGKTNQDLLHLPVMKHPTCIATLKILNLLFLCCYQTKSPVASLIAFRAIAYSIQYGIHEASSVSFAAYSMILCYLKFDLKAARKYSEVAISIAENTHSRIYTPVVYYLLGSGVTYWCNPIQETFDDLIYSSKTAMEVTDIETAVIARANKCVYGIFCGVKLVEVEEEIDHCIQAARLYRKQSALTFSLIVLQFIECWIGKAKNPAILDGTSVNFPRMLKECEDAGNRMWISIIYFFSVELAYHFSDYELAARMTEESMDLIVCSMFFYAECIFKEGLNGVALSRKGLHKSKSTKIAKDSLKKLNDWVKASPQQGLRPKQLLLDAEIQSLRGSRSKAAVYPLYEKSLKEMKELNLRNEVALVAERFADYKVVCGDVKEAKELYRLAKESYSEWGAIAKVIHLNTGTSKV